MADRSDGDIDDDERGGWRAYARAALDLMLPRTCPGCHRPGSWCAACAALLAPVPRSVAPGDGLLDPLAAAGIPVPPVRALAHYGGPVRAAIVAGKERGRRDLPPLLGDALGAGIAALQDRGLLPARLWLVPAPTRVAAARARGGDPVTMMARAAALHLAAAGRAAGVAPCLFLDRRARDSVGLDAAARAANLAGAVRYRPAAAPAGPGAIVLVDDVFTTGSTAAAALVVLARRGLRAAAVQVVASAAPPLPRVLVHRRPDGSDEHGSGTFDPLEFAPGAR